MSLYEPTGFDPKRAARAKAEGARRRAAMPPPGFRLVSEEAIAAIGVALLRRIGDANTDLHQVPMRTRGSEHVQLLLAERGKNLAVLREINPSLAEVGASFRFSF